MFQSKSGRSNRDPQFQFGTQQNFITAIKKNGNTQHTDTDTQS